MRGGEERETKEEDENLRPPDLMRARNTSPGNVKVRETSIGKYNQWIAISSLTQSPLHAPGQEGSPNGFHQKCGRFDFQMCEEIF